MKIDDNLAILYSQRILVFLETAPQSNKYAQALLTEEQYKKVSEAIVDHKEIENENGMEFVAIRTSEEEYDLPDLQEIS